MSTIDLNVDEFQDEKKNVNCFLLQQTLSQQDEDESESMINETLQILAENTSYEIEKVVDEHKDESGQTLYRVRLVGYSWIPHDCLLSFQHLIKEYHETTIQGTTDVVDSSCPVSECFGNDGTFNCVQCDPSSGDIVEEVTISQDDVAMEMEHNESLHCNQQDSFDENNMQSDNQDIFPMQTAFIVTIDNNGNVSNEDTSRGTVTSNENSLHCDKCNQQFSLKSNMEVHSLFCNATLLSKSLNSFRCNEVTVDTEVVQPVHETNNTSENETFEYIPLDPNSPACSICSQRLPEGVTMGGDDHNIGQLVSNSRLKETVGDDMEIYECTECNRAFLYKYRKGKPFPQPGGWLEKIIFPTKERKMTNTKPFQCKICNRGFVDEKERNEHEANHKTTQTRYTCTSCNEKFVTRRRLEEHFIMNDKCQRTRCELCGHNFLHNSHLKRHLSLHAGLKPFVCSICSHEFNQRSDLKRHEGKHINNNGDYVCLKCQSTFLDVNALKEHILAHKNNITKKEYSCPHCEKVFGRNSHYKRHLSIHEGVKPHVCLKCGKRFNQSTDLKRHEQCHVRKEHRLVLNSADQIKSGVNVKVVIDQNDVLHQEIVE